MTLKYDVYTSDEMELRHILTQELMEKIMVLSFSFESIEYIDYSFVGDKMYIAFETNDNFLNSDLDISLNDEIEMVKYFEIIESVSAIVDELKLNEYLWIKG